MASFDGHHAELAAAQADIAAHRDVLAEAAAVGGIEALRTARAQALESRRADLDRARTATSTATAAYEQAAVSLRTAELSAAEARASLAATDRTLDAAKTRWEAAGLSGAPDTQAVAEWRRRIDEQAASIAAARTRMQRAQEMTLALERSRSLQTSRAEVDRLMAAVGCDMPEQLIESLGERVDKAAEAVARVKHVYDEVDPVRRAFADERDALYARVVDPVQAAARRFRRALALPLRVCPELSVEAQRRRAGAEFLADFDDGRPCRCLADGIFSEGQMASVALCYLLAMSVRYRWSRWPALLLDDPVQYNDVVHVAAFIDAIRGLIRDLDYQVVMSTHDADMAAFLRRKLDRVKVETRVCQFQYLDSDGSAVTCCA
jgi:hypothetical protein